MLSHTEANMTLHTAAAKLRHPPKCAACLYGKQTIRSAPGSTSQGIYNRAEILHAGNHNSCPTVTNHQNN